MDRSNALEIARRYADAVKEKFDHEGIFLFGSYAKGTPNKDSDIDIAVVLKDYVNTMEVQLELMRLRRKIDSRIEPHPFREIEFNTSNPLASEVIMYGQIIEI